MSGGITTSFAVARSTVSNGSMNLRHVDDFDADDSVSDSDEANGLPGKPPASQGADAVPALDVAKLFFDTFWIVRDGTTPNTVQGRRLLEGFSTSSVCDLFSSVFELMRAPTNGALVAVNKQIFGRALNIGDCLPVGAQVLDSQYVGIVNDNGDVHSKRQRRVLTGGRFVSTEDELGACASALLELPIVFLKREFREILASEEMADRDKTKEMSKMLKQRIQEHLERVRGTRAQSRADRVARDPGAIASTSQPQTIVPKEYRRGHKRRDSGR